MCCNPRRIRKPSTNSQSYLFELPRIHDVRTMAAFINMTNIPSRFEIGICLLQPPTKSLFTITRRGIHRNINAIFPIGKGLLLMKAVVASMLIGSLLYSSSHGVHATKGCSMRGSWSLSPTPPSSRKRGKSRQRLEG